MESRDTELLMYNTSFFGKDLILEEDNQKTLYIEEKFVLHAPHLIFRDYHKRIADQNVMAELVFNQQLRKHTIVDAKTNEIIATAHRKNRALIYPIDFTILDEMGSPQITIEWRKRGISISCLYAIFKTPSVSTHKDSYMPLLPLSAKSTFEDDQSNSDSEEPNDEDANTNVDSVNESWPVIAKLNTHLNFFRMADKVTLVNITDLAAAYHSVTGKTLSEAASLRVHKLLVFSAVTVVAANKISARHQIPLNFHQ